MLGFFGFLLRLRGGRLSFPITLARRRFRFAYLHSRGDVWLFRLCVALAFFCLHFQAKRNGGGFGVGSGSNDNGKHVNAIFGETMMKR